MRSQLLNALDKPFLEWEFDEENNWLYLNWIGYCSQENIIKGVEVVLDILKEKHCQYILNDNRLLAGPWEKSNDWLEINTLPKLAEYGIRFFAHVLSPGIAGALSAQDLHCRAKNSFTMQLFGDIEKAKAWLKNIQLQNNQR